MPCLPIVAVVLVGRGKDKSEYNYIRRRCSNDGEGKRDEVFYLLKRLLNNTFLGQSKKYKDNALVALLVFGIENFPFLFQYRIFCF